MMTINNGEAPVHCSAYQGVVNLMVVKVIMLVVTKTVTITSSKS